MSQRTEDPSLRLPRILCLHGGGTNSKIFRLQLRTVIERLKPYFRFVFPDAPYTCETSVGVLTVYGDCRPFRRWLRWLPEHGPVNPVSSSQEIYECIKTAMDADDLAGGTGEWTAILGFSQGAKIAGSLLLMQQKRKEISGVDDKASSFRFGVLMAGQAPLVTFDPEILSSPALVDANWITMSSLDFIEWGGIDGEHTLRLPTIHVHGLKDPGLERHRILLRDYCAKGTTRLIEWDGDHRLPFKKNDVEVLAKQILEISRQTG